MPRGKKTCPSCGTSTGSRKRQCECGYEFVKTEGEVSTPAAPEEETQLPEDVIPGPPAFLPRSKRGEGCATHLRYEGSSAPKVGCPVCWRIYLKKKFDLPIEAITSPAKLEVSDPGEVLAFLADLKRASDASRRNCGYYSAFLHGKQGQTVQIELHYSASEFKAAKDRS